MTVLDELSGFEFEDVMEDVFRKLGYENVRTDARIADEGRDILMEEQIDGRRRAVVVECKHTDSVGRPVVQKLHSAVATYDYDGPRRGIVATTGRFTGPATEYARELRQAGDPYPVELLGGDDLRAIADEIGLDLYNGRIEILCDQTLRPDDPSRSLDAPVSDAFREVKNIDARAVPEPELEAKFLPVVCVRANIQSLFETGVGVIHTIDQREAFVLQADRNGPRLPDGDCRRLVVTNLDQTVELDEEEFGEAFDEIEVKRFGRTETEYKEWAVDRLQRRYTSTVTYTGDNNVTYTKECEPNLSDISVQSITPVYLPRIRATTAPGGYAFDFVYDAAGPSRRTVKNEIHQCVQCGDGTAETYTYCENCGSINCPDHTRTERLVGEPVCTGCSVTGEFFLSTKYFYSERNREQFRAEYEEMPIHERAMENKPLIAGAAIAAVFLVLLILASVGVV